ncbi:hypothetical protein [uncultured Chryseobacterium sp.]|uniref:leucine-rich repeat domain-containing protein n=1 Tax=uncultured Chryseobacterium sp. TaxID=259322 RepID=UPI002585B5F6|nr:hypothetical protein [uncultured Chryseobacterium sp.]
MKENHQTDKTSEAYKRLKEILGEEPSEDYAKARIKLKNLTIDDFSVIFPLIRNIRTLDLSDSTISNFSELLKLENCYSFHLDNVTFTNNDCEVTRDFPSEIHFSNMNFDASGLNCFPTSVSKGHHSFSIENCHIENIQELSNIEGISALYLDKITFTYHPRKIKEKSIYRISISDSQFKDISFIPFKKSVGDIDFVNCRIGNFEGISELKELEEIGLDNDTIVEDIRKLENPFNKKITCVVFVKDKKQLDLKNVLGIRNYINHIHFTNFKGKKIDNLEKFERLHHLTFDKSKFYVDAFLSIAKQIQSVEVRDSAIKKHSYFKHFPNLTSFELNGFGKDSKDTRIFSKLFPLKKQLKELEFYESQDKPTNYPIEKFTALESLKIGYNISLQTVESILTFKKLKKLEIRIEKTKKIIDLGNLKNLEFLNIYSESNLYCTGFEHLKRLKSLDISSDGKCDINMLPKMKSLKRLSFYSHEDCAVKGLSQFPNLEFLKLEHIKKLQLKTLKKLKVLDLRNSAIKNLSSIETLPSLEKLDLSCIQNNIDFTEISKFPNLKWLTLLESYEVNDISSLEPLKKLERLDLYRTKVTDVRVLNTLPNLKEVNLAVENYELNLEKQLDRPEIAIYCGLPSVNLWIWEKDEFGI